MNVKSLGLILSQASLLVWAQACTQYKPQSSLTNKYNDLIGLIQSGCSAQKEVYKIVDGSNMEWVLETINKDGSGGNIKSTHRASGTLGTIQGKLNNSKAIVLFNMQDLATGDVARDRILRDQLFSKNGEESFRLILEQIDTKETSVGANAKKVLRMVAKLEMGDRIAPLIFDADVSEKDGIYHADGRVEMTTRDSRAAINAISLRDKIEKLTPALGLDFSNTMSLHMELFLKKDCQ